MVRMNVSFSEPVVEELGRAVPRRKRSAFIVEAVKEKLDRIKQVGDVEATAGSWSDAGRRDPVEEVRKLRSGWRRRPAGRAASSRGRRDG